MFWMRTATSLNAASPRSRWLTSPLALVAVLVALAGCGDDGPSGVQDEVTCESAYADSDAVSGLTTITASGTLSATIDGAAWSAREDICVSYGAILQGHETLVVFGYDDRVHGTSFAGSEGLSLAFETGDVALEPGSYTLDGDRSVGFMWFTVVGALQWTAAGRGDLEDGASGMATITTLSANRISGTFSFIGLPNGHASPNVVVTNGSFDLTF
jgi:hypothetical protein